MNVLATRKQLATFCWIAISCSCIQSSIAQQTTDIEQERMSLDSLKFKIKTLGGKQFWTDVCNIGGWRIQENAVSGHARLIDPKNVRHESGSLDQCRQRLDKLIESKTAKQHTGKVVVVLHGLIRTTDSMRKLGKYLQDNSDLTAVDFEYASTRRPVAEHAKSLARVMQSLGPEVTEINFVGHSLGNIVVRHYLADCNSNVDDRIRRMVMIGPPNNGSKMARVLRRSFLFNVIAGSSGIELGAGWENWNEGSRSLNLNLESLLALNPMIVR